MFYTNDFDGNENITGSLTVTLRPGAADTSGSNTVIRDSTRDMDADNELVLFDGRQVGGYAEFADETFDSVGGQPVTVSASSFTMTATVDIIGFAGGTAGNGQIDGFSFNFGDTSTLPPAGDGVTTPRQGALEQGVSEGLAIRVIPIQEVVQIVWNGVVLASASSSQLESWGISTFSVSVDETGFVAVSFANVSLSAQIPQVNGESGFTAADQSDWGFSFAGRTGGNGGEVWIDDITLSANIICFASGTMIETETGLRRVEDLRPGDNIRTRDSGFKPALWIGHRHLSHRDLVVRPHMCPVQVRAGALGPNMPEHDLSVSPQHRILISSAIVARMTDKPEVLIAAKHLLGLPGVEHLPPDEGVTYHHIIFDQHEVIRANGCWTESLLIGPQLPQSIPLGGFLELVALFPELGARMAQPDPARLCLSNKVARSVVRRHVKNSKPLYSDATRPSMSV